MATDTRALARPSPLARIVGLGTIYGKTVRDSLRAAIVVGGVAGLFMVGLLVAAIWLHTAKGHAGDNRFGPEPTAHGFSMPNDAFWQRTPHAGTA